MSRPIFHIRPLCELETTIYWFIWHNFHLSANKSFMYLLFHVATWLERWTKSFLLTHLNQTTSSKQFWMAFVKYKTWNLHFVLCYQRLERSMHNSRLFTFEMPLILYIFFSSKCMFVLSRLFKMLTISKKYIPQFHSVFMR